MSKKPLLQSMTFLAALMPPLLIWAVVGMITYAMPLNSLRLSWMERQIRDIAHPEASTLVATVADVGLIDGKGDSCDVMAGEIRRTALSAEALRDFYGSVAGAVPQVFVFDEPVSEENYIPNQYREVDELDASTGERAYAIFYYEAHSPEGDLRCW